MAFFKFKFACKYLPYLPFILYLVWWQKMWHMYYYFLNFKIECQFAKKKGNFWSSNLFQVISRCESILSPNCHNICYIICDFHQRPCCSQGDQNFVYTEELENTVRNELPFFEITTTMLLNWSATTISVRKYRLYYLMQRMIIYRNILPMGNWLMTGTRRSHVQILQKSLSIISMEIY